MIARVDAALYLAKLEGRDRVNIATGTVEQGCRFNSRNVRLPKRLRSEAD